MGAKQKNFQYYSSCLDGSSPLVHENVYYFMISFPIIRFSEIPRKITCPPFVLVLWAMNPNTWPVVFCVFWRINETQRACVETKSKSIKLIGRLYEMSDPSSVIHLRTPNKLDESLRAVTGSRMNCRVTTVEGLPSSTGLNSSCRFFNAQLSECSFQS